MSKIDDAVFEWSVGNSHVHFMDRNGELKIRPLSYPVKIRKEINAPLWKNIYSGLGKKIEPKIIPLTLGLTNLTTNIWFIPLSNLFGDISQIEESDNVENR